MDGILCWMLLGPLKRRKGEGEFLHTLVRHKRLDVGKGREGKGGEGKCVFTHKAPFIAFPQIQFLSKGTKYIAMCLSDKPFSNIQDETHSRKYISILAGHFPNKIPFTSNCACCTHIVVCGRISCSLRNFTASLPYLFNNIQ